MKRFDAVKIKRDIRTQLSERYQEYVKLQSDDLQRIHEKYGLQTPRTSFKRSAVAENEANYGEIDSD
jgi:siroheme synthase (precorrin-2 oxidase/ferrochelatase)